MSEGTIGLIILIVISISVAAAMHLLLPRYFTTSLVAAVLSNAIFQFAAYLHAGYLGPFFPIALLIGGALAYGIALVVGLPIVGCRIWIRVHRLNREDK